MVTSIVRRGFRVLIADFKNKIAQRAGNFSSHICSKLTIKMLLR